MTEQGDLVAEAIPRAMRVVGAVHDGGPDEVRRALLGLSADQARALVVVLAAMVDPELSARQLLAWVDWDLDDQDDLVATGMDPNDAGQLLSEQASRRRVLAAATRPRRRAGPPGPPALRAV